MATASGTLDAAYKILSAGMVMLLLIILVVAMVKFYRFTHLPSGASCVIGSQCSSGVCNGGGLLNLAPATCN